MIQIELPEPPPAYDEIDAWLDSHPMFAEPAAQAEADRHRLARRRTVFVSGLSRSNRDLDLTVQSGLPVGISVHAQITEPMRRKIIDYVNDGGGALFVDSGSYTAFTRGKLVDWDVAMGRYKELFYRIHEDRRADTHFVAPDVIGDPEGTVELMIHTCHRFQFIMEDGGNAIVPVQREPGGIDPGTVDNWWPRFEFGHRFIVGIPYNKHAWSEDEVVEWLARNREPEIRLHLLGGGPVPVASLVERVDSLGLPYGTISGDSFHGPACDRKYGRGDFANTKPKKKKKPKAPTLTRSHYLDFIAA